MDMVVFEALRRGDWSERLSALVAIQEAMEKEKKAENLWSIQQAFDSMFLEDEQEGVIFTLEILVLRERFCQLIREFTEHSTLWEPVLFTYIHDRLPDTHPQPDPNRSGPEWSAGMKLHPWEGIPCRLSPRATYQPRVAFQAACPPRWCGS